VLLVPAERREAVGFAQVFFSILSLCFLAPQSAGLYGGKRSAGSHRDGGGGDNDNEEQQFAELFHTPAMQARGCMARHSDKDNPRRITSKCREERTCTSYQNFPACERTTLSGGSTKWIIG
jgi:hypothetical protein